MNNIFVVAAATLFGFSRRAGSFEMIMLGRLLVGVSAGTVCVWGDPLLPLFLLFSVSSLFPSFIDLFSIHAHHFFVLQND